MHGFWVPALRRNAYALQLVRDTSAELYLARWQQQHVKHESLAKAASEKQTETNGNKTRHAASDANCSLRL
jgi:hypothetical protein